MNKTVLKLLSCGVAASTLCSLSPISAQPIANYEKKSELSTTAKVCIGLGVGAVTLIAGGAIVYAICNRGGNDDVSTKSNSVVNANLSNIDNLCFWHSFVQQMYSLKSFRKFVNEVNLSSLDSKTANKIVALRDFFKKMDDNKSISQAECQAFARVMLADKYDCEQHDINEVLDQYIGDVSTAYDNFCAQKYNTSKYPKTSNIIGEPITFDRENLGLQDLLLDTKCWSEKRQEFRKLMSDANMRNRVLRDYLRSICIDGTVISDDINADNVGNYVAQIKPNLDNQFSELIEHVSSQESVVDDEFANHVITSLEDVDYFKEAMKKACQSKQLDVPVLDDQFVLFVSRAGKDGQKNSKSINLGDGKVTYKGVKYQVTAVSVHVGQTSRGGHYYSYKKGADGNWYCYNDCPSGGYAKKVSFESVKNDAQDKCTMFTFSKV